MQARGRKKDASFVLRAGDWCCTCNYINNGRRRKCRKCEGPKTKGTILKDKANMKCRKRRKSKLPPQKTEPEPTNLCEFLNVWSNNNTCGKNINVKLPETSWIHALLESVSPTSGAHIHNNSSKWKFFKINLSGIQSDKGEWIPISNAARLQLASVAETCLSAALEEVAQYTQCSRVTNANGVRWTLPCGEAAEICSLIFQPCGSEQQRIHKDGHMRYCLPGAEDVYYYSYFLNVIIPLCGDDVPTIFRDSNRKLIASERCNTNEIRVFNGGRWHAGAANTSNTDVWKLFVGLVPGNHATAGDFPLFSDGGKSLAKQTDRCVLVADTR